MTVIEGKLARVELPVEDGYSAGGKFRVDKEDGVEVAGGVNPAVDHWIQELEAYFRGERLAWTVAEVPLEVLAASDFQRTVYAVLLSITPGTTVSYGSLARAAGFPGAARAVGRAMSFNPAPVVIPCHRVVRSDGCLGGYSSGILWKERLLAHEKMFVVGGDVREARRG